MNDINCWQPQIMKTLCGHLALFEALTQIRGYTHRQTPAGDSYPCERERAREREMDGQINAGCSLVLRPSPFCV